MKWRLPLGLLIVFIYLNNAAWFRSADGDLRLLAHRGVHQNYSKEGLLNDSCTASRIDAPEHQFLENTTDSISEAFSFGADIVEIDIHPTSDGRFAVFHDWTLDCRANAGGRTRDHTLAYLQSLDIAYGYTHDGGKTFPLRGLGVGKMPSLRHVLETFPNKKFLINIKSNDPDEADLIDLFLGTQSKKSLSRVSFYGPHRPTTRLLSLKPQLRGFTKESVKKCVIDYALIGWSAYVPKSCRNTIILLPRGYARYFWGWPNVFVSRMKNVNTDVILVDLNNGKTDGIDDPEEVKVLAASYRGIIWTDKIEKLAPH